MQLLKLPNEIMAPSLSPSTGIVHVRLFFSDTEITMDSLSDSVTGSLFGSKIVDTFIAVDALGFYYFNRASDLCPVLSLISLLSTFALNKELAQVTLRQCAVFRFNPTAAHISGKILFNVFMPTGVLSKLSSFEKLFQTLILRVSLP